MACLEEDTAKWNKKLFTTFIHTLAELYARNEREVSWESSIENGAGDL